MKYAVVLEKGTNGSWGAYAADLPGIVVVGDSERQALDYVDTAIDTQIEGLHEDGFDIPRAESVPAHIVDGLVHVSGYSYSDEVSRHE